MFTAVQVFLVALLVAFYNILATWFCSSEESGDSLEFGVGMFVVEFMTFCVLAVAFIIM